tara:strand:+ start:356 stop:1099 length:744 start_codon:yes stop_codon:yes gene_type:complete
MSKTEDFLDADKEVRGQNFVCLSFVSPSKDFLTDKETYMSQKFLKKFKDDILFQLNLDDELKNNDRVKKLLDKLTENIGERYNDYKKINQTDLDQEFNSQKDGYLTMRGLKVRGCYETLREAQVRAKVLQKTDQNFHVFVGQVGYWLPWDPEADHIEDQEYQEEQLNELVKGYKEQAQKRDEFYEERRKELSSAAKEEGQKARTDNKIEEISTDTKNDEWEKAKEETIETTDEKSDKNMREIIENIF